MPTTHDFLERCDKLAVMGGTFDPIHNGHIAVANAVLKEFSPRRVLFMPGGHPPHKPPVTDGEHRFNMALAAVCENPAFDVSRLEIDRKGRSYTVDTISELRKICPVGAEIYFIIGADALMEILTWEGAERLLSMCEMIAVHRPGYKLDEQFIKNLRENYGAKIHIFEGPLLEISGTEIRNNFSHGQGGIVPRCVEDYARSHGLYGTEANPFEKAKAQLKSRLSPRRFHHTLGTVIEAEKLAAHYGADVNKARWAALLHDCAKEYSSAKKRALCELWGIPLDPIFESRIDLTHSLLGAESARRDYLVTDPEILQAIARHTTGGANMTLLDKIILLADFIEPHRDHYPPLLEMRRHAYKNLNKALRIGMKSTVNDLLERGNAVHPATRAALKELKQTETGGHYGKNRSFGTKNRT
ncbi:MAG: nicotinate-nucleotide adenylyltransferase [Defluviitaleaceae bacterium]|nr:nicotinate-nucleotide adenylyltransferase [Defluviitaleaceae bacterium]